LQVTLYMDKEDTKKREIKGVIAACKEFNASKGMIITLDLEDEIVVDEIVIEVIPFYKWAIKK